MSDPAKFLAYTEQLATELSLLADSGHRQFVTMQSADGQSAAIIALGVKETAMLHRIIANMEADPEFVAWRADRGVKAETDLVAALAPSRN